MENINDRTERLLALILLRDLKEERLEEKIRILNMAGFTNTEVAELLNTKPQVIANYLYKAKKKSK